MAQEVIATIGTFDGVHMGHQSLVKQLIRLGLEQDREPLIFTFYPHPAQVLRPDAVPELLCSAREKSERLESYGVQVETLVFSRDLSNMTAEEFLVYLRDTYNVSALLVGYDHHFGRGAGETFEDYERLGRVHGIDIYQGKRYYQEDGITISSTNVRKLLREGRVEEANSLLGYTYEITGSVMGGMRVGRSMGYPTANINPEDAHKLIPADGVYAVRVLLSERTYYGMLYIGKRPTLDNGDYRTIEVNIFDLNADLYTKSLTLCLDSYVRSDRKFDSLDELKAQIAIDEATIRRIFQI